ncbi:MAG: hypothetical protein HZA53_08040 [Planctomycetes bacterium]|nr:hypothetical protein [Planctomycetota bacterium]
MSTPPSPIDLSFRPESYFDLPTNFSARLLSRIQGAERRALARFYAEQGRLEELTEFALKAELDPAERRAFGRLHPACMGGEYLPSLESGEVEIARVVIASTTQDVTCVYARPGKRCIEYRVVDEYDSEFMSGPTTRRSRRPLTLKQLVEFLNDAWPFEVLVRANFLDEGERDIDAMLAFFVSVESEFYPQFDALYRQRLVEWATEQLRDSGQLDAGDEAEEEGRDA